MKALKALCGDDSGGFAIAMAIGAVPLLIACGVGLDYSTAFMKRSEMQNAADSAVLLAASSGVYDKVKLEEMATNVFYANLTTDFGTRPVITKFEVSEDRHITLIANANIPLTLGKIIWSKGIDIGVLSQAVSGSEDKVEIAMVLDTTYSMSGQKLTDLKSAANSLLDVFEKADADKSMARFSIVPFSRYVNVGMSNRSKSWLDVPDDYTKTYEKCTTSKPIISQDCKKVASTCSNDGVSYSCTKNVCTNQVYGPEEKTCKQQTDTYKWTGCVGSRNSPLDVKDSDPAKRYTGLLNTSCGSPITTLSNDYKALRAAIKAMTANNETYVAPGVLWGWNTLSASEPFTHGANATDDVKKFMIVMTDGANTKSPSYPKHDGSDAAKADTQMNAVCDNAESSKITIFTIGVGIDSKAAATLAKCATSPDKAFTVEDSAKLVDVFKDIAGQILTPRLTM
ncbi:MAG: VWA domain-containing protein [Rhizobium sp.]|nr:VWA domain-containing protein [Rhizobium sp.]